MSARGRRRFLAGLVRAGLGGLLVAAPAPGGWSATRAAGGTPQTAALRALCLPEHKVGRTMADNSERMSRAFAGRCAWRAPPRVAAWFCCARAGPSRHRGRST